MVIAFWLWASIYAQSIRCTEQVILLRGAQLHAPISQLLAKQLGDAVDAASVMNRVPRHIILAVIEQESYYQTAVVNKNDYGIMQIQRRTAEEVGVPRARLWNPRENIAVGAKYLALLKKRHATWPRALTAYNKGSAGLRADGYRVGRYALKVMARATKIARLMSRCR